MSNKRVEITPATPYEDLPSYLTLKQVAAFTQMSYWTVWEAVRDGRIPSTRLLGRKLIFIRKELFAPQVEQAVPAKHVASCGFGEQVVP
jgi:excisionase family DNA binding protein